MSAKDGTDNKRLTCRSCGYKLADVRYFAGEKETNRTRRVVEFYCPKCKSKMIVE